MTEAPPVRPDSRQAMRRVLRALPLLAVLMVLLSSLYLVSSVEQDATQLGRMAMWVFITTGVALILLVVVIFGRLVKLIQRLRAKEPGARLTARLVAVFTVLALPPVVILYLFAIQFLTDTVEGWLDVDAERALAQSIELGQMFLDLRTREVSGQVQRLADQLDLDDEEWLFRQLLRQVSASGPTELAVLNAGGQPQVSVNIDPARLTPELPSSFALVQALDNQIYAAVEPYEDGIRIRVLVLLGPPRLGASPLILQAIHPLPRDFSGLAGDVEAAYYRYRNVAFLRDRLQQSLILILTLVLLLTALLAMLVAFNAARRLSQPVRELAVATEEIAAGRFPDELAVTSRDELGFLVRSFNVMTRELAASRQALESQRRYLEIVLGRLSAGVLAIDRAGCLSAFNESAARILGLDAELDSGLALKALRSQRPDLAPLLDSVLERRASGIGDWRKEIQLGQPDRPLVLVCRGSDLPAETGGQVVVFDDVTVLDQAQREAAWAEVARRLAHEVKNPLTPIQLAAERLQYKLESSLTPDQVELLTKTTTTIRAQVDTLKRLVDAFGDYARPVGLRREPLALEALINEVADLYASGAAPVQFEIRAAPDAGRVMADPHRLRQVLLNLVRNAQEARADGAPSLQIELAARQREAQPGVLLTVRDNGPGFASEVLDRVFEPYVTTKPRGTGLGLAIVRRIIEEHGGHIELGNHPDGGAHISLWLPAAEPQAEPARIQ
ncbi:MAG: HAMP domain-containing protein [Wenzhouxiangella sp.]|nr:HAMP domain-containing protein [Wenzhouxiangella sp.]TVR97897.1 MAG: HAMP domain-containing protein [Wenzhouxiangellaceae bacterium]